MKLSSYTQPQVLTHLRSCVTWPAWLWRVVAGRRRPQSVCRTAGTHSVPSVPGWRSDRCVCPSLRWHRLPVRQTPRPLYPPHARTWFPCRPLETPGSELCVYAEWSVTKISNGLKIIRYWNLSDTARFTNYYFTYNKIIKSIIYFFKSKKVSNLKFLFEIRIQSSNQNLFQDLISNLSICSISNTQSVFFYLHVGATHFPPPATLITIFTR